MNHTSLLILATIMMLPGLIGLILPIVPGIPYMFVVALIFAFVDKFVHLTGIELVILLLLALASIGVDYFSGLLGAKYGGASRKAMLFGFLGTILGTIMMPPFGGLIGLFVGVLAVEMIQFGDQVKAVKAATGGVLGALTGMAINILLGLVFIILFIFLAL